MGEYRGAYGKDEKNRRDIQMRSRGKHWTCIRRAVVSTVQMKRRLGM